MILDTLADDLFDVLGFLTIGPDTVVLLDGGAEDHLSWWVGGHQVRTGGRRGRGPGELVRPRKLFRATDTSFAVVPWVGRRISHFTNQGSIDTGVMLDRGPLLVGGDLFPGADGTLWFIGERSGAPPTPADSLTIWNLDLRFGVVREWGRATGGGRVEQATADGKVSIPIPLWVGDMVVAWGADTVLVIDPRTATMRMISRDHDTQSIRISGLHAREVPPAIRDSIVRRWQQHPNAAFRSVRFDVPAEFAIFDHVIADVGHRRLWVRTVSDADSTRYAMIAMPSGAATASVAFPGLVELLEARGDSLIALSTGTETQSVIRFMMVERE